MKGLQLRGGALLMWRLGPLNFGPQERWDRAPEARGMWSFPFPYFEMFYAYHKYSDLLPKRLQTHPMGGWPVGLEWYGRKTGATETVTEEGYSWQDDVLEPLEAWPNDLWLEPDEEGRPQLNEEFYGVKRGLYDAQEEWVNTVGKRTVKRRKFFYEGELYAHFDRKGNVEDVATWHLLHTSELAKAIVKARGDRHFTDRNPEAPWGKAEYRPAGRYSHDHFEVFIPPNRGTMGGRLL